MINKPRPVCPYDDNEVTTDLNDVFWEYWNCNGCGNRWILDGTPVGGKGERLPMQAG